MTDILELLPWFFAGILFCAGIVLLLDAKHLVPAIVTRVTIRRVSLAELLDSMCKLEIIESSKGPSKGFLLTMNHWNYDDDINAKIDPDTVKRLKEITGGNNDGRQEEM